MIFEDFRNFLWANGNKLAFALEDYLDDCLSIQSETQFFNFTYTVK